MPTNPEADRRSAVALCDLMLNPGRPRETVGCRLVPAMRGTVRMPQTADATMHTRCSDAANLTPMHTPNRLTPP